MEIDQQFESVTVHIECKKYQGSGCLIQPSTNKYTYVLTAKHCLVGIESEPQDFNIEDINIKRYKNKMNEETLTVLDYYLHEDENVDLAIIIVKFINELYPLRIEKSDYGKEIELSGYPGFLDYEECENKRELISGKITVSGDLNNKLEFKMSDNNETLDTLKASNIEGFSGSGIFSIYKSKNIVLNGIYEGFKDSKGALGVNNGYCMEKVEEMIDELKLEKLYHYKLISFKNYIEHVRSRHCDEVRGVLENIVNNKEMISPKDIIYELGEKLFYPNHDGDYIESGLWTGWLELLAYMELAGVKYENISKLYYYENEEVDKSKIKMYYSEDETRLIDVCSKIFRDKDEYNNLEDKSTIILNTLKKRGSSTLKSRGKMIQIVGNIDKSDRYKVGIDIRKADCTKNISAIHIDEFLERLSKIEDCDIDIFDAEDEIIKIIKGVFNDAFK